MVIDSMALFHHYAIIITYLLQHTCGYLDIIEINVLNELYNEWNGEYWTFCKWNISLINNQNNNSYINNHCGLIFNNHTNTNYYQFVDWLWLDPSHFMDNLTGTIPTSIGNLSHLSFFQSFYLDLYGIIPIEFCNMYRLNVFSIHGNRLNGAIPSLCNYYYLLITT
eukprot:447619_1